MLFMCACIRTCHSPSHTRLWLKGGTADLLRQLVPSALVFARLVSQSILTTNILGGVKFLGFWFLGVCLIISRNFNVCKLKK